jgi:hypothetical protein
VLYVPAYLQSPDNDGDDGSRVLDYAKVVPTAPGGGLGRWRRLMVQWSQDSNLVQQLEAIVVQWIRQVMSTLHVRACL